MNHTSNGEKSCVKDPKPHRRGEETDNFRYENYESDSDSGTDKHEYSTCGDVFCSANKGIMLPRDTVGEFLDSTVDGLSHQNAAYADQKQTPFQLGDAKESTRSNHTHGGEEMDLRVSLVAKEAIDSDTGAAEGENPFSQFRHGVVRIRMRHIRRCWNRLLRATPEGCVS